MKSKARAKKIIKRMNATFSERIEHRILFTYKGKDSFIERILNLNKVYCRGMLVSIDKAFKAVIYPEYLCLTLDLFVSFAK